MHLNAFRIQQSIYRSVCGLQLFLRFHLNSLLPTHSLWDIIHIITTTSLMCFAVIPLTDLLTWKTLTVINDHHVIVNVCERLQTPGYAWDRNEYRQRPWCWMKRQETIDIIGFCIFGSGSAVAQSIGAWSVSIHFHIWQFDHLDYVAVFSSGVSNLPYKRDCIQCNSCLYYLLCLHYYNFFEFY